MLDLIIRNGLVTLPDSLEAVDIGIRDGVIAAIAPKITECAKEEIDASGQYVLPGMVDPHMHLSEPGRTEWEGYRTGTQACAAGGITSFVEMPLNQIPCTIDLPSLEVKLKAAEGQCWVDYAPMGGLVPWNLKDIGPLADAGVAAFKAFVATCGSGKPGDFKNVNDWELYQGCREIAKKGGLLVVHCENATITDGLGEEAKAAGETSVSAYVESRPIFTEVEAVHRVLMIAEAAGCRIHIAHCSCPEAVEEVERAKARGVDASFESCPHYLLLATEDLDAIGPKAKCSPPIRDRAHQRQMWDLLAEGRIEMLVSDHSPCTIDLKSSPNAFEAWGGISGCQNCVDAMFDEAVLKRGISPVILAKALATGAARRFRLKGKGEIALGFDADLVMIDPKQSYVLRAEDLYYKNKFSAYEGRRIDCRVARTLVRGREVFSLEKGPAEVPTGRRIEIA
ncbi:allantoinase AllB [Sutterella sp.]|uniref:allantoinase AllB n=1 Tax=Sutterella sp. TaxID=1981025 RepID=UPI0026DFD1A4|nr:allantoinase AllB [Sutterella sp.]MDO5531371.1 allantoinase AllB [Sutterella sp.]